MSIRERGIDQDRIERVARMYSSNEAASQALGVVPRSFSRLCRQFGVETPCARRRRERDEARLGRAQPMEIRR